MRKCVKRGNRPFLHRGARPRERASSVLAPRWPSAETAIGSRALSLRIAGRNLDCVQTVSLVSTPPRLSSSRQVERRTVLPRRMTIDGLRVALFSGNYNMTVDGANKALNRLVEYLLRQGAAVRVYSPTVANPDFEPTGDLVSV